MSNTYQKQNTGIDGAKETSMSSFSAVIGTGTLVYSNGICLKST